MYKVSLLLPLLFFYYGGLAQSNKQFKVEIILPTGVNTKFVQLYYHDGKQLTWVKSNFSENKLTISARFWGRYATIRLVYRDGSPALKFKNFDVFWVDEREAVISFRPDKTGYPLGERDLVNALEVRDNGASLLDAFIQAEVNDFKSYYATNEEKLAQGDTLVWAVSNKKSDQIIFKTLAFIKQNSELYFTFRYFRQFIDGNKLIPSDTLIKIYNTIFPESFRNSEDGYLTELKLKAISLKKDDNAPSFEVIDIHHSHKTLESYRGKYLLLTFWASWCKPCIKEIPILQAIRKAYSLSQLAILSNSQDTDSSVFLRAVKKYQMNWEHTLGSKMLNDKYGVVGIPEVFLITPNGQVLYVRREEKDYELNLLVNLLKQRLGN